MGGIRCHLVAFVDGLSSAVAGGVNDCYGQIWSNVNLIKITENRFHKVERL
jgi:hypothetical protein